MARMTIPKPVAVVVGQALGDHYYNHRRIEMLFMESGAPSEAPEGNCVDKCAAWLKLANETAGVDPLTVLGGVLEEFMEVDSPRHPRTLADLERARARVHKVLRSYGLAYRHGGKVGCLRPDTSTKALEDVLRDRDWAAVEAEFERALVTLDSDPPAAVTAACAIVEALCKIYIEDEKLEAPSKQSLKPLWSVVQRDLGLELGKVEDADLLRVLSGLSSIADGIGALRTHAGSAHGRGRKRYRIETRHARLAVSSAHTLVVFLADTWDARRAARTPEWP